MARPPNTEARRAEIVEALVRVMAERGYARSSVAAIAEEAGLTQGLVHYHFKTKQDVLLALVDRVAATVDARWRARDPGDDDPLGRLDAFVDAHLATGDDADPAAVACWVALGAEALAIDAVREAYVRVMTVQRTTLEGLVSDAMDAPERAPSIAAGILAAIEGAFRLAAIDRSLIPEGSAAGTVRAMARALVTSPGATS